jgi:hypothetical protein
MDRGWKSIKSTRRMQMRTLNHSELLRVAAADDNGGNEGPDISGSLGGGAPIVDLGSLFPLVPVLPVIHSLPIG